MNYRDLINNLDRNNPLLLSTPNWSRLFDYFYIDNYGWSSSKRLKCYYIDTWLCTDTWVGSEAYFLDDEFICMSRQSARKSSVEFYFVSNEAADKLKNYLISLTNENGEAHNLINFEDEIDKTYKVDYHSQLLATFHKEGKLKSGEHVLILETSKDVSDYHNVVVSINGGKKETIDVRNIDFEHGRTFPNANIIRYRNGKKI